MQKTGALLLVILVFAAGPTYAENASPANPYASGPDNKMPVDTEENLLNHMDQILKNKNVPLTGKVKADLNNRVKQRELSFTTDQNAYINSVTFSDGFTINIAYDFDTKGNVTTILFGHGMTFISVSMIKMDTGSFLPEDVNLSGGISSGNVAVTPPSNSSSPPSDGKETSDSNKHERLAMITPFTPAVPTVNIAPNADKAVFTLKINQTPEEFASLVSSLKVKHATDGQSPSAESFDFTALKQIFKSFDKAQKIAFQTYIQESNLYYLEMKNKLESDEAKVDLKKSENVSHLETRKKIDHRIEEIIAGDNRDSFRADVHTSQIRLFREYIEPSQKKLRQTLQDNFAQLGKKIELLIPGKTTIHIDGDITEILIYLSIPS